MSDETNERYCIEIRGHEVVLFDNTEEVPARFFTGPDRLLNAVAELNRLNAMTDKHWTMPERILKPEQEITPAAFLAETLPAKARRQRLEAHLREVIEIGDALSAVLAADAANLERAIALREKLEKELVSPPSSTLPAQNADLVGQGTPSVLEVLATRGAVVNGLFKPGPY